MQYSKLEKNNSVKTDSDKVTQMYSDGGIYFSNVKGAGYRPAPNVGL